MTLLRILFISTFVMLLSACGGDQADQSSSIPMQRVMIALVDDQDNTVSSRDMIGGPFLTALQSKLTKAGHQVTLYTSHQPVSNATVGKDPRAYTNLLATFSMPVMRARTDILMVLRLHADVRDYGTMQLLKSSVDGEIIKVKNGKSLRSFRSTEQQISLPKACKGPCASDKIRPLFPALAASISDQALKVIGDREPLLKKQAQDKLETMQEKAPELEKKGVIDKNEAIFLSLTYNIELRGVTEAMLRQIEPYLTKIDGYEGHKVAYRTPEKKRFILHYNSRLKMADLRDKMNEAIQGLGYGVTTYIYAKTFQVYVTEK